MRKWGGLLVGLLLIGCAREERKTVEVFFTADVQGFYFSRPEPRLSDQEAGGYGVLANFFKDRPGDYLLFDGGNWFGSGAEGTLFKGSYLPVLSKNIPFIAGTLTDKDLVYGWPVARNIVKDLAYPLVVSNLQLERQIPWPLHDYQIRTVNGIKFGIFGIISPLDKNRERLPGLVVLDPVKTAQQMTDLLREKGVDYVIVLSSLVANETGGSSETLAAETEGIDLILSSNQDSENPDTQTIKNTRIVYPGSKLDSVAQITLSFDTNNHFKEARFADVPLLKETYGEDAPTAQQATQLLSKTREQMKRALTTATKTVPTSLTSQSALGSVLAQCLHKWAKLDGAVLNSLSIRSSLPAGKLTEFDLYKTYPYGDNITFLTIKGAAFTQALEAALNTPDNFPQVAGFTVQYMRLPNGTKKITRITLDNGRIVRPQETYRFAVTDHMVAGGFGYDGFINALEFKSTFVEARQIMRTCLLRQKTLEIPAFENRWKLIQ